MLNRVDPKDYDTFESFVPCERSQQEPCYPFEFEQAMSDTEQRLRGVTSFDEKLRIVLERAVVFYQADRAHIIEVDWDLYIGNVTYECCADGLPSKMSALQNIDISRFPRWRLAAEQNVPILLSDVESIRDSEPAEYEFLEQQGANSLLGIPLHDNIPGYFIISNPKRYRRFAIMMRILSHVIAAEITKQTLCYKAELNKGTDNPCAENEVIINFFGGLEVITANGRMNEANIKAAMRCKLIAYLYFNRNKNVDTLDIVEHVWAEQEPGDPANSVKNLVYLCRKTFDPIFPEHIIEYTGAGYSLNRSMVYHSDIEEFDRLCQQAKIQAEPTDKLASYDKALRIYKGSVMPRHDYVLWILSKASYYSIMHTNAMMDCMEELFKHKMYFEAYQLANHALSFDKTNEDFNFALIKSLICQGAAGRAEKHFSTAYGCLSDEQKKEYLELLKNSTRND